MIIKVCGLKNAENYLSIAKCSPDMVGLNFYPQSSRYLKIELPEISPTINKVGVFVNAPMETIKDKTEQYSLDFAQLHGDESPDFAHKVQEILPAIKVFRIHDQFDFSQFWEFAFCRYYLLDTYTKSFGGSGLKFGWEILKSLEIPVPFLLSGGIGPEDAQIVKQISHPMFAGVDINSKFETTPGIKNVNAVHAFIRDLKNQQNIEFP